MTKAYSIFLTVLFTVFIGGVLVISALLPKEEFSEMENRFLQKPPELSIETVKNGKFMENAEKYVSDHIAGRDLWVAAKAWGERLSGKQENNGVYFAAQDTLINRVEEPDGETWEQLDQNLEYLDQLVSNAGVPVYFGLIPSAAQVWHDRLPDGAPTADEAAIIETLYSRTAARTVDLLSVLSAHSGEELYYRTDHHWTSLGAYYGYTALMNALGMEPVSLDSYTKQTVSDSFYGTVFSSSGVRWVEPDSIDIYVPDPGVEVTSWFTGEPEEGALYNWDKLDIKDKYTFFMGGNQSLGVIKNPNVDGPKILLLRDSYTDSLVPFLTQHFSEIHLIDLRYYRYSIPQYIKDNDIDMAVVLYSVSNFVTDTNLFTLRQP